MYPFPDATRILLRNIYYTNQKTIRMDSSAPDDTNHKVLMIFFEDLQYSQDSDTGSRFDVSLFGDLVDADVGWALTEEGTTVQRHYHEQHETMKTDRHPTHLFDERYWITDDELLTDRVRLRTGEVVSCTDYDVILVSHVVFHVYYIGYLKRMYPDLTVVSVQDESIYEVESLSARMQTHLIETLSQVDGFVAMDETYARWVRGVVDDIIYLPQPVPQNQFQDVADTSDGPTNICLGCVPFNTDSSQFVSSLLAFQQLVDNGYDLEGTVLGVRNWQADLFKGYEEAFNRVSLHRFVEDGYYDHLAEYDVALQLTPRQSAGRCSADFAGVGVPCVGSEVNDLQRRCFPELSVDPYDVGAATDLVERLLTDQSFYDSVVETASEVIDSLQNHDQYRDEFARFINQVASTGGRTDDSREVTTR